MDAAGLELITELVRITARISAAIFVAALAAGGADLLAPPSSSFSRRGVCWKLIGAVIVSHTIHFGFVAALAVETHGQNVMNRGGWILTSVVGALFYVATIGALVLRRVSRGANHPKPRWGHCVLDLSGVGVPGDLSRSRRQVSALHRDGCAARRRNARLRRRCWCSDFPEIGGGRENGAQMTARDALAGATAAQPGERLHQFETICGPRGGCDRAPVIGSSGRWTWCAACPTVYDDYGCIAACRRAARRCQACVRF